MNKKKEETKAKRKGKPRKPKNQKERKKWTERITTINSHPLVLEIIIKKKKKSTDMKNPLSILITGLRHSETSLWDANPLNRILIHHAAHKFMAYSVPRVKNWGKKPPLSIQ